MTNIEVDQSGKMGNLSVDTVLACSDDLSRAILIPAKVKRALIRWLRERGKSKTRAAVQLFAAGLFLLLKDSLKQVDRITIDVEYTGYDADIRGMLLHYIRGIEPDFDKERLVFYTIGKKSPAHRLALATYQGKVEADKQIGEEELLAVLEQTK